MIIAKPKQQDASERAPLALAHLLVNQRNGEIKFACRWQAGVGNKLVESHLTLLVNSHKPGSKPNTANQQGFQPAASQLVSATQRPSRPLKPLDCVYQLIIAVFSFIFNLMPLPKRVRFK
jgi:hypothetical protein